MPGRRTDRSVALIVQHTAEAAGLDPARPGSAVTASAPAHQVPVDATTFDTLAQAGSIVPEMVGLVWIDTQGHEGTASRRETQRQPSVTIAGESGTWSLVTVTTRASPGARSR
jgi:hypothetical protein